MLEQQTIARDYYHFTWFPLTNAFNINMTNIWQGMNSSILHKKTNINPSAFSFSKQENLKTQQFGNEQQKQGYLVLHGYTRYRKFHHCPGWCSLNNCSSTRNSYVPLNWLRCGLLFESLLITNREEYVDKVHTIKIMVKYNYKWKWKSWKHLTQKYLQTKST